MGTDVAHVKVATGDDLAEAGTMLMTSWVEVGMLAGMPGITLRRGGWVTSPGSFAVGISWGRKESRQYCVINRAASAEIAFGDDGVGDLDNNGRGGVSATCSDMHTVAEPEITTTFILLRNIANLHLLGITTTLP